jgi:hypothetical protein
MWYVDAHKGGTTIHLPCWGQDGKSQQEEAESIAKTLTAAGWTGPVKEVLDNGNVKYHSTPRTRKRTVEPSHPHWRAFLEDA